MKLDKITLTIPNSLYGDKTVTAYTACGLAVAKVGRTWTVYHVASGATVNGRCNDATKRAAQSRLEALVNLAEREGLNNAWESDLEGNTPLRRLFDKCRDEIREIMK